MTNEEKYKTDEEHEVRNHPDQPHGVIDESYCGDEDEWKFPAYALRDTTINANDRICQFRIMKKQPEVTFEEVEHLESVSRHGFGSTGTS